MIVEQQFPFLAEKRPCGLAGGRRRKTTLLYAMASHCAQKGWRVLVSTTTHILRPENWLWAKTDAEIQELWARGSYAVVGSPAPKGKLTAPPEADLAHWMAQADAVFLEADGAKHFPCKAPAEQEPILLPQSNIVLAVAGLSALGHPLKECCFRLEQACMLLGVPPEACLTRNFWLNCWQVSRAVGNEWAAGPFMRCSIRQIRRSANCSGSRRSVFCRNVIV